MPLEVQLCSLVVRRAVIEERHPGGWAAFERAHASDPHFFHDAELVRFEAMGEYFGDVLEDLARCGIRLHSRERPGEAARDPLGEVPWLELGAYEVLIGPSPDGRDPVTGLPDLRTEPERSRILACRLRGGCETAVVLCGREGVRLAPGARWSPWTP